MKCLAVLLAGASLAWAASAEAVELSRMGIKGGMNLARLDDGGEFADGLGQSLGGSWDQGFRERFVGGVFAEFALSPTWILRPEVQYARKGEAYTATFDDIDVEVILSLDYVEVPALVLYRFPASGSIRPGIFVGPAVAFEVDADVTLEAGSAAVSTALGDTKDLDVSVMAGLEVMVKNTFFLEGRIWNGFIDIDESSEGDAVRNQGVSFLVGIGWDLRTK